MDRIDKNALSYFINFIIPNDAIDFKGYRRIY